MKHSLFLGTLLGILTAIGDVAFAQGDGNQYARNTLNRLQTLRTIESDIRIETLVNGKTYTALGHYAEQVLPNATQEILLRSMYRLDIHFPMNSPTASVSEPNRMTLVCHATEDGRTHRIERYTSIEGMTVFSTVDLKKLDEHLKKAQREPFFSQVRESRNFGIGGLAGKMQQIYRLYDFSSPIQENLQDEQIIPTWKLTGILKSVYHKELLTLFGGLNKQGQYPPDFPSDIEIWLGQHNDFPYKIRYLRRTAEASEQKNLLYQESFHNVVLDGTPISASKFAPLPINPEDVFRRTDETDKLIRVLE